MSETEQVYNQIERAIRKIAQKFSENDEASVITDIHIRVFQDSGELRAYDDEENEITRCVVEEWIDNTDEDFYGHVTTVLRKILRQQHDTIERMNILKPFSFVLEDDEMENIAELYVADGDTVIIGGDLMGDLDAFLDDLLQSDDAK